MVVAPHNHNNLRMNDLVAAAHPYLVQYGDTVLFAVLFTESFGLPLPGETFLIGATLLAINGQLGIAAVAGWAIAAVILGDNVGYLIGPLGKTALDDTARQTYGDHPGAAWKPCKDAWLIYPNSR